MSLEWENAISPSYCNIFFFYVFVYTQLSRILLFDLLQYHCLQLVLTEIIFFLKVYITKKNTNEY